MHIQLNIETEKIDTGFFYSSQTQVIIEHSYLGPLCLQFANPPSLVDVKSEIMERTGLPIKHQDLYCNGKKVRLENKHISSTT